MQTSKKILLFPDLRNKVCLMSFHLTTSNDEATTNILDVNFRGACAHARFLGKKSMPNERGDFSNDNSLFTKESSLFSNYVDERLFHSATSASRVFSYSDKARFGAWIRRGARISHK